MSREADSARHRERVAANPNDRVAWHNLAAAEGDLGRMAESEKAARRAIELGIAAPETRLVLARALQSLGMLDEAERAFEEAIGLRPGYVDAHRDLAQLRWMRTGEVESALERLDEALAAQPAAAGLRGVRSAVLECAGHPARALQSAEAGLARSPDDAALLRQAAHLCIELGETARGLDLAQRAGRAAPEDVASQVALCEALLADGKIHQADWVARILRESRPNDQYVVALQAAIWRISGDARYAALHDYARLVGVQRLDVPSGWATLEAFLADLAAELDALHPYRTHPLNQSVRGGSQRPLLDAELSRPVIAALFQGIGAAVQRYVKRLGRGDDPVRRRNTGRFGISGAWSVRLRSGGHHADHVHPHGWISSACYIALPPAIGSGQGDDPMRAGWLRLGKPAIRTRAPLAAEHFVKPEPGNLVLFPAYMWHGVEPFESDAPRLSVAFDVVPV